MRTKALLVTAAIGMVSLATSFAQVYSVNVVGYVNVPITAGFNCVANPLDATPDNVIGSVIPVAPDGTQLLKWAGTSFANAEQFYGGAGMWMHFDENVGDVVPATATIEPGEGFFINSPVTTNVTFVGEVRQGNLSKTLDAGFNLISQITPQAGDILTFSFPANDGDQVLFWQGTGYGNAIQYYNSTGMFMVFDENVGDVVPVTVAPTVGQGFFVNKAVARTWSYTFNVNTP